MTEPTAEHRWSFYRAGGVEQARIASGADILAVPDLDQKLWMALSCPVSGLEFCERTLALLDTDGDGRVRAPEIQAAIRWIGPLLRDPDELLRGRAALPLQSIDQANPEGKKLHAAARRVLSALGKAEAQELSVEDAAQTATFFEQSPLNGDGVVPADSLEDEAAKQVVADAIACLGETADRSGKPGVDAAKLEQLYADAAAYSAWYAEGEAEPEATLPLGAETAAAAAALEAVRAKVEDFFARCRLAAYDGRAAEVLDADAGDYEGLAASDLSQPSDALQALPLARVAAGAALPLGDGVNPAWSAAVGALRARCVTPLLGERTELTPAAWAELDARFAAFRAWQANKQGVAVEGLGVERVRALLADEATRNVVAARIEEDAALKDEMDAVASLEKLVHLYRDLYPLLNNFVAFADFYAQRPAVFQAGTLYLDARSCDLCVRVADPAKHATLAALSKCYVAYCECTRKGSSEKLTIAAAFTAGDSDNLMVGRNGVFYDRKGQDWDATVVKVIENAISIRQAFWLPYKRVLRWVEEAAAKRAAAADAGATEKLQAAATSAGSSAQSGKPPEQKPRFDVGTIAALGVAVGGITAALGALLEAFFGLGAWMPLGLLALVLLISGPSMLIAWMKLRQRNLGPILDANGWAVNGRLLINMRLGAALTGRAALPKGARLSLEDPYAPKQRRWPLYLAELVLLVVLIYTLHAKGYLGHWISRIKESYQEMQARNAAPTAPAKTGEAKTGEAKTGEAKTGK
ncbi:MAG: hypothetical protein AB7N76_36230 [Planctomycetota bacterium]